MRRADALADPNDVLRRAEQAAAQEEQRRLRELRDGGIERGPQRLPVDPRDLVLTFPGGPGEVPPQESVPTRDPQLEGLVGRTEPFPGGSVQKPEPVFTRQGPAAGQPGAVRVNPRTGAEEQFAREYVLAGDGRGRPGEVLEYRRPGGGRTLLVDPASSATTNGVEAVYLPTSRGGTVVATNPAADRIALEVQVPDGVSTSPSGHRVVHVRRGPSTTPLAGIPGGSAGATRQFATQDPLVERVVVSPSELQYGYAGSGLLRRSGSPGASR